MFEPGTSRIRSRSVNHSSTTFGRLVCSSDEDEYGCIENCNEEALWKETAWKPKKQIWSVTVKWILEKWAEITGGATNGKL
jgi:hypothetical protein